LMVELAEFGRALKRWPTPAAVPALV